MWKPPTRRAFVAMAAAAAAAALAVRTRDDPEPVKPTTVWVGHC